MKHGEQAQALRESLARINAAQTRQQLDALALEMMGLECVDCDDNAGDSTTLDDARDILRDSIKETCFSFGIHCAEVFDA